MGKREKQRTFDEYCSIVDLFESCVDGYLYVLDMEKDEYYISHKALERFDMPSNLFTNTAEVFRILVHKNDIDWLLEDLGKMAAGKKQSHDFDYRWMGKDRNPIWINCVGRTVCNEEGKPVFMIGCVNEIGRKQRADNVSGLKESSVIEEQIDTLFGDETKGYCLHVGIDHFRAINERFGMEYGDLILRAVANSIASALCPEQQVYRVVADEYIVISPDGYAETDGAKLYQKIQQNIEAFVKANGYEVVFTVSAGVVSAGALKGFSYTQALKRTQFALGEAKEHGRNQVYFFDDKDYKRFIRRKKIISAVKESIAADFEGFEVYYQPIMPREAGVPYAAEALLRYRMRNGENVWPNEFIPILEETGMIIPVGKWVLHEAMKFCKLMQQTYPDFRVDVNVSYVQVIKSPFLEDFLHLLNKHELSPASIVVELTESGKVVDSPQIHEVWTSLKREGVSIALDDFGTGYSNLLYISEMTPNVVKLDRGFTVKAMTNSFERMLMTSTIQLVHSLGLNVCVEGVETENDLTEVHALGADLVQGYYYSKPCPKQEFIDKFM